MKPFISLLSLLFATYIFAISPMNFIEESKKLNNANVELDVNDHIQKNDFRFVSISGYVEKVPGVENYLTHYSSYGTRRILGTSDSRNSKDEESFNKAAENYAKKYNQLLLKKIKK